MYNDNGKTVELTSIQSITFLLAGLLLNAIGNGLTMDRSCCQSSERYPTTN